MTPHPDQLLLDGRTLAEAETPTPRRQPPRGYARWAADVDGVRTVEELAAVWWPSPSECAAWRPVRAVLQAQRRLDDLCRLGHVLPPFDGWHRDTVPQRATPEAVAAMLAPVDGRARKPHDGLADAACLALWGEKS